MKALHKILMSGALLGITVHGAYAQTAFTSEANVIPDDIFAATTDLGSCQMARIEKFLDTGTNRRNFAEVNASFLLGACQFFKNDPKLRPAAIEALQRAQLQGLGSLQQNLAVFLEGLLHTRQAQDLRAKISGSSNLDNQGKFCMHRSMAASAFHDIRWSSFDLNYQTPQNKPTLDSLIAEMSQAYGGSGERDILSSRWDGVCGITAPLEGEAFAESIQTALEPVKARYLGPTGPIGAMFSRKIEKTRGVLDQAKTQVQAIATASAGIKSKTDAYSKGFAGVETEVGELVTEYEQTVLSAYRILDEYNKWSQGMWEEEVKQGNTTIRVDVKKSFDTAASNFAERVAPLKSSDGSDAFSKTTGAVDTVLSAFQKPDQTLASVRSICAVYYCQVKSSLFHAKMKSSCQKDRTFSRFCNEAEEKKLASVCEEASFTAPTAIVRPEETNNCIKPYL